MFVHITLVKFKDSTTDQEIDEIWQETHKLRKLKGVVDIRGGQNVSSNNDGFTHAIVVTCKQQEAFQKYRTASARVTLRQRIEEIAEKYIDVDFEDK